MTSPYSGAIAKALAAKWTTKWQEQCKSSPAPLNDQLSNDGGMQAGWTIYFETCVAPYLYTGMSASVPYPDPDPTPLLWFGKACGLAMSGDADRTYAALVKFANDCDTRKNNFDAATKHLFAHWSGPAASACNNFVDSMTHFIELQRDAAVELAKLILAVRNAAVAAVGSTDGDPAVNGSLSACMNALVNACNAKGAAVDKAQHDEMIKDMQSMVTAGLSMTSAGISESRAGILLGLATAAWNFGKDVYTNGKAVVDANADWMALQKSYISQATAERNKVGDLIKGNITTSARKLELSEPPQLPDVSVAQIGYDDK